MSAGGPQGWQTTQEQRMAAIRSGDAVRILVRIRNTLKLKCYSKRGDLIDAMLHASYRSIYWPLLLFAHVLGSRPDQQVRPLENALALLPLHSCLPPNPSGS